MAAGDSVYGQLMGPDPKPVAHQLGELMVNAYRHPWQSHKSVLEVLLLYRASKKRVVKPSVETNRSKVGFRLSEGVPKLKRMRRRWKGYLLSVAFRLRGGDRKSLALGHLSEDLVGANQVDALRERSVLKGVSLASCLDGSLVALGTRVISNLQGTQQTSEPQPLWLEVSVPETAHEYTGGKLALRIVFLDSAHRRMRTPVPDLSRGSLLSDFTYFPSDSESISRSVGSDLPASLYFLTPLQWRLALVSLFWVGGSGRFTRLESSAKCAPRASLVSGFEVGENLRNFLSKLPRSACLQPFHLKQVEAVAKTLDDPLLNFELTRFQRSDKSDEQVVRDAARSSYLSRALRIYRNDLLEHSSEGKRALSRIRNSLDIVNVFKTITPFELTGGAIRSKSVLDAQARLGLKQESLVFDLTRSFESIGNPPHEASDTLGADMMRVFGKPTDSSGVPDAYSRFQFATSVISASIRKRQPRLIHAHSGRMGFDGAMAALKAAEQYGTPVLYEMRSFHEATWGWGKQRGQSDRRTRLRIEMENLVVKHAARTIVLSSAMKEALVERGGDESRIDVIPNCVDDTFLAEPLTISDRQSIKSKHGLDGNYVLGYVSNFSLREGHIFLLRALAEKLRQEKKWRVLLIGTGPTWESVKSETQKLKLEKYVALPGEIPRSQIREWMSACDLFIVPRVPELAANFVAPLKPIEAMACGVPVLLSDLPALRELAGSHQERASLFKAAEPKSLRQAIDRIHAEPELTKEKVGSARQWILQERTSVAFAAAYQSCYQRMLSEVSGTQSV